jgi:inositol transport system ATP-binding protein
VFLTERLLSYRISVNKLSPRDIRENAGTLVSSGHYLPDKNLSQRKEVDFPDMGMGAILEAKGITKSFTGIRVLNNVDFELQRGEIHAIVGENGAGKSTLMKILMGEYRPDSGETFLDGKPEQIHSPAQALALGIAMVHQELNYMPYMSVADYMYLGREPRAWFFLKKNAKLELTKKQLENIRLEVDPNTKMGELSVSDIQMIEIAKVISYGSKIVILDEPTSSLSETEVDRLFEILNLLKASGVSVIYISHRLEELNRIADKVTILRDGDMVLTEKLINIKREDIVNKMVGREIEEIFPEMNTDIDDVLLAVKGLTREGEFENISFDVRRGEIVGLAGLVGAGRTEIVTAIYGEKKLDSGEVHVKGKSVKIRNSRQAVREKIAFVSEDRKLFGLNLIGSVKDNIALVILRQLSRYGLLDRGKISKRTGTMMEKLQIKARSPEQFVESLSGGNQQKVVLAKWLLTEPEIFIMDEPTRGIDVGAKSEVYKLMNSLAREGKAIILISSELPEVVRLCNRVIVLHEGKITGELERDEITQESIMLLASG